MTSITIELPEEIVARIDARPRSEMSREHIVSLLVGLGLQVVEGNDKVQQSQATTRGPAQQQVETVAMHLRDRLRMYLDQVGSSRMSDQPEVVAAIDEVIGAAMTSGWSTAGYLLVSGCSIVDFGLAVANIVEEFDYKTVDWQ